ncbi:uncharacterized protein LOC119743261 [Patiria miniata]|uniref:Uncharacterized protein n=1 Tax=Patiria miniata TaxID=46514 RepID=A0A914BI66_PATMI|nr:uncharacterized protein LOC119743261 [Patiria miniata]
MMGGPWRSVPDLLYETYSTGDLQRGYPSDPGFITGCCHSNTLPSAGSYRTGESTAAAPRNRDGPRQSSCPSNVVCLRSTSGNTTTFTVASASLTRLANGDDKMCIACQQYHLRRPEPITRQPQKNSRPQYIKVTSDWSTKLFGCMEDEHTCKLAAALT